MLTKIFNKLTLETLVPHIYAMLFNEVICEGVILKYNLIVVSDADNIDKDYPYLTVIKNSDDPFDARINIYLNAKGPSHRFDNFLQFLAHLTENNPSLTIPSLLYKSHDELLKSKKVQQPKSDLCLPINEEKTLFLVLGIKDPYRRGLTTGQLYYVKPVEGAESVFSKAYLHLSYGPDGQMLLPDTSGGCIRIKNYKMISNVVRLSNT